MTLSYAEKQRIRGMLADKQSAKTIALEFEVGEADVLALAKPKAVCMSRPRRRLPLVGDCFGADILADAWDRVDVIKGGRVQGSSNSHVPSGDPNLSDNQQ